MLNPLSPKQFPGPIADRPVDEPPQLNRRTAGAKS
jgi:hypothetical protein